MIHPSFRRLDEPPMLFGYSLGQLGVLVLLAAGVIGVLELLHPPVKLALTVAAFAIALPAMLMRVNEAGATRPSRLLADAARALRAPGELPPAVRVEPAGYLLTGPPAPESEAGAVEELVVPW